MRKSQKQSSSKCVTLVTIKNCQKINMGMSYISRLQATENVRYKGRMALRAASPHNTYGFGTTEELSTDPDSLSCANILTTEAGNVNKTFVVLDDSETESIYHYKRHAQQVRILK